MKLTVRSVVERLRVEGRWQVRGLEVVFEQSVCTAPQPGSALSQHAPTKEGRRAWRILTNFFPNARVYDVMAREVGCCCLFVEGGRLSSISEATLRHKVGKLASAPIVATFDGALSREYGEGGMLAWRLTLPLLRSELRELRGVLPSWSELLELSSGDYSLGVSRKVDSKINLLGKKAKLERLIERFVATLP